MLCLASAHHQLSLQDATALPRVSHGLLVCRLTGSCMIWMMYGISLMLNGLDDMWFEWDGMSMAPSGKLAPMNFDRLSVHAFMQGFRCTERLSWLRRTRHALLWAGVRELLHTSSLAANIYLDGGASWHAVISLTGLLCMNSRGC